MKKKSFVNEMGEYSEGDELPPCYPGYCVIHDQGWNLDSNEEVLVSIVIYNRYVDKIVFGHVSHNMVYDHMGKLKK